MGDSCSPGCPHNVDVRADLPVAAAGVLGLLAVVEVVAQAQGANVQAPVALLLALCSTVPLAFVRTHAVSTTVTVLGAMGLMAISTGLRPPAAGMVAGIAALGVLGWQTSRHTRAAVARRGAYRDALADTLVEYAARGERARIARELHDVVAHHLSMISLQAEAARLSTPGLPAEEATRLSAIGDSARTALAEMRRLLGLLREDAGDSPNEAPQPGLEHLNDLVDGVRDSSRASYRLIVRGPVAPLDPGLELTAYRVVQEALTNARRHAPGASVDVELTYTGDALRLRVRDNGPGPGTAAAGHGLMGMRERISMVGGSLVAGAAPRGGFLVEAHLPAGK